jgi:hypothetical protein
MCFTWGNNKGAFISRTPQFLSFKLMWLKIQKLDVYQKPIQC